MPDPLFAPAAAGQPPGGPGRDPDGPGTSDPPGEPPDDPPQPPDDPPPGNDPCAGEPLDAGAVSASPAGAVVLGKVVEFRWNTPPGWTLGFAICCESDEEPPCGPARIVLPEGLDAYRWCAGTSGTFTYVLDGTDENGCRVETTGSLTVRPPDTITPDPYSPKGRGLPLYVASQDWQVSVGRRVTGTVL